MHRFSKKCQKLHRAGENQGDQLVRSYCSITLKLRLIALKGALRVTGTGGKPSTWFPPEILVELPPVAISS